MSELHLVRIVLHPAKLAEFAHRQGLLSDRDDGQGYLLHALLSALFGSRAPKPFRWDESSSQLLGYCACSAVELKDHAQAFAQPQDWAVLVPESVESKPMPAAWRVGQRLQADVLACPVSRRDDGEKDVFLRAIERLGDDAPGRTEVYVQWFHRQWGEAVALEHTELLGHSRVRLLRRGRRDGIGRRARVIERPQALFRTVLSIQDAGAFSALLHRGIGRHRAFGYGMVLLKPTP